MPELVDDSQLPVGGSAQESGTLPPRLPRKKHIDPVANCPAACAVRRRAPYGLGAGAAASLGVDASTEPTGASRGRSMLGNSGRVTTGCDRRYGRW